MSLSTSDYQNRKESFKDPNLIFYPNSFFTHLKVLNANYKEIKKELEQLITSDLSMNKENKIFQPWIEYDLYNESNPNGWDIAPFVIGGKFIEGNCKKAPFVSELLKQIPGIVSGSFSLLKPNTHIVPHQGYDEYSEKILRYHLGLIVPSGDLGIRVCNEVRVWKEGESFIFDDYKIHEAWNFTNEDRYVLICDFVDIKDNMGNVSDENFNKSVSTYINQ